MSNQIVIAYFPVFHGGVRDFIRRTCQNPGTRLMLVDEGLAKQLSGIDEPYMVSAWDMARGLGKLLSMDDLDVRVLDMTNLRLLPNWDLVVAQSRVCRLLVEKYLSNWQVTFDSAFVHWDHDNVMAESTFPTDRVVTLDEFVTGIVERAYAEAAKSPCYWRQVGAVAYRDGKILGAADAYNTYCPTDDTGYAEGDVRTYVEAGTKSEICNSIHAEAKLTAIVAKNGDNLVGASVYVTCAPCIGCAQLLIEHGVKQIAFSTGGAYVGVDRLLKDAGVETVKVQLPDDYFV